MLDFVFLLGADLLKFVPQGLDGIPEKAVFTLGTGRGKLDFLLDTGLG